jgi:hypothetical protein
MKAFDEQAILTPASGLPIDKSFFTNDLDRTACALMHQASKNVILYRDNPFYADNRPSLKDHVDGLMELFQSLPSVKTVLGNQLEDIDRSIMVCTMGKKLMIHDYGEVLPSEGLSFHQKVLHKELIPDTKRLEKIAAPLGYEFALHHAALKSPDVFLKTAARIQYLFSKKLQKISSHPKKEAFFKQNVDRVIQQMTEALATSAAQITPIQYTFINKLLTEFSSDYEACETSGQKSVDDLIVKTLDKNCLSYNENGFKKYLNPEMKSITMDREPNTLALKTIQRSEEFLLRLAQEAKSDPIASYFYQDINTVVCDYLKNYTLLGRPLIYLDGQAPQEVDIHAPRSLFIENHLQQKELIDQRRANHIHPLQDSIINSGEEIAALAMTNQQLHLKNTHSILDRSTIPSRQMIELFDHNLKTIQSNPLPKHPDYVTRPHP